jgi:hypothetical protein
VSPSFDTFGTICGPIGSCHMAVRTVCMMTWNCDMVCLFVMSPLWDIITGKIFMMTRVARWVLERV